MNNGGRLFSKTYEYIYELNLIRQAVEFFSDKNFHKEFPSYQDLRKIFYYGPRKAAMVRSYYKNGKPLTWDD